MSFLEMALKALNRDHREVIHPPPVRTLCAECPWYSSNPWSHYPEFPSWCSWHCDHLEADSQQCAEWRKGEIPHTDRMRIHRSGDFILGNDGEATYKWDCAKSEESAERVTCFQCHYFKPNDGPNPGQAWGDCRKRGKGRCGVATACEAVLTSPDGPGEAICSKTSDVMC